LEMRTCFLFWDPDRDVRYSRIDVS
jgi:hypothetical protein